MEFLDKWLRIIRNCSVSNTYKMAWAKAITEIAVEMEFDTLPTGNVKIPLADIARKVLSYYWEQTIYFNLVQGSNPLKPPVAVTLTQDLIKRYFTVTGTQKPVKFYMSRVEHVCPQDFHRTVTDLVSALKADVSYRFVYLSEGNVKGVYEYSKGDDSLEMAVENLTQLRESHTTVFEAIKYRWAQILEDYNQAPRICKKVRIIDEQSVRRKPLHGFTKYLDAENPRRVCFICGIAIVDSVPTIAHVIPWSFLYSDDLWNLVYAHQSCNSSKSNTIPTEEVIRRLERRNTRMLEELVSRGVCDKQVSELEMAVERGLVKKYWISCQG